MANIDEFINGILSSQNSEIATSNDSERDGNPGDVLFRTEQPSLGIGLSGGTTLTSISPITAIQDAMQGKLNWLVLLWIGISVLLGWYLLKK